MQPLILILFMSLIFSCGKKSSDSEGNTVTTTPPVTVEDDPENIVSNDSFSIKID